MDRYTENTRRTRDNKTTRNTGRVATREGVLSSEEDRRERQRRRRKQERMRQLRRQRRILIGIMASVLVIVIGSGVYIIHKILDVDYVAEGTVYFEAQDYYNALTSFEAAVEKGDDLDQAYLGLAYTKWEMGAYDEFEAMLELAYENGAEVSGASRNMLASLALQEEDYELALDYIQEALTLDGNTAELTQELLRNEIACYEALLDWDTAKAKMDVYIATYPDDEEAATEAEFLETR